MSQLVSNINDDNNNNNEKQEVSSELGSSKVESSSSSSSSSSSKKNNMKGKFGGLKPKRLQHLGPTDVKRFNSTSTMFVDNTISVPDNQLMMKAVANKILELLLIGEEKLKMNVKMSTKFNTPERFSVNTLPGKSLIYETIKFIFKTGQLSIDCTIIALVYIDRILKVKVFEKDAMVPIYLNKINWQPLVGVTFMLASKVWDDLSMINQDFSTFLPYELSELNEWERRYLNATGFNVRVGASVYAEYYFNLRQEIQQKSSKNESSVGKLPLMKESEQKPLDKKKAARLEALTQDAQHRFIQYYGEDTNDLDGLEGTVIGLNACNLKPPVINQRRTKSVGDLDLDDTSRDNDNDDTFTSAGGFAVLS